MQNIILLQIQFFMFFIEFIKKITLEVQQSSSWRCEVCYKILSFKEVEFKALLCFILCVQKVQCDQASRSKATCQSFCFPKNSFCNKSNMTNPYEYAPRCIQVLVHCKPSVEMKKKYFSLVKI